MQSKNLRNNHLCRVEYFETKNLENYHLCRVPLKGVITCRVRGYFFIITKKILRAPIGISPSSIVRFSIFLMSRKAEPTLHKMLYLDLIFICYNQNTITVIKTNSFRGAIWRAKSYLSGHRFMRGTRVYWSRIGPKQFPNVSTTFPVGFQRITLHESMDVVSAPDPYGPGMWLPLKGVWTIPAE